MTSKDSSKIIISVGIIVFLVLITWTAMGWPLGFSNEYFWIFIFVSFIEAVIVIIVNEIIKGRLKKKKKDNKKLQKINNILLIIVFILGALIILAISWSIYMFKEINQYSKSYPEGVMTYKLKDYDKELIIPSYSIISGEYWDELIVFKSPKNVSQLEREINDILNSEKFSVYETEDGNVYYNDEDDYTIVGYEVNKHLFMNTFNLVYCDGLCN